LKSTHPAFKTVLNPNFPPFSFELKKLDFLNKFDLGFKSFTTLKTEDI